MIEQINIELLKLQEELTKLKTASEQIAQAGKLTKDVVEMGKSLNDKYREYLKKVQDLVSDYMNKTYKHTEENLTKLFYSFQQRVKEEQDILNKFQTLSAQSEDLLKQVVDNIINENKKRVEELVTQINLALDKQQKLLDKYGEKTQKSVDNLINNHQKRLETEEQILSSYLELAEQTAQLTKVIEKVDFPKRLESIDARLNSLNKKQDDYHKKIQSIILEDNEKLADKLDTVLTNQEELFMLIKQNQKKIKGNKILIWIIFSLSTLFYLAATTGFLRIFTDFFDSFCK